MMMKMMMEKELLLPVEPPSTVRSYGWYYALLFTFTHTCTAILAYSFAKYYSSFPANELEHLSSWMSSVDRGYRTLSFNPFEEPNAFTAPTSIANDTVEDRWLDLGAYANPVLIPQEFAHDFGLNPSKHVLIDPTQHDVPYPAYLANVQALHQLHCVDYLRQGLFYNYDYYRSLHSIAMNETEDKVTHHLAHCVDSLRQMIMCESDARIAPYLRETLKPDFAQPKRCRNFEALRRFAVEHQWFGAGDNPVDDHHLGQRVRLEPDWPPEKLWRGY